MRDEAIILMEHARIERYFMYVDDMLMIKWGELWVSSSTHDPANGSLESLIPYRPSPVRC